MGYDDGECVECRLERNGGNVEEDTRYDICMGCLHEAAKWSSAMDGRLMHVLEDNMGLGKCDKCGCRNSIIFDVSVCMGHYVSVCMGHYTQRHAEDEEEL